jgi:antitoxin MazE
MAQAIVGKWGKSLAVRLPGEVASAAGICAGERVEIEARDGGIVIRRAAPYFTLAELFHGKSPREWRQSYAGAYDWGPDRGREIVEE